MIENRLTIINKLGLHARAAAKFVNVANKFQSEISVSRGDRKVNGKSIMGIMMLAAAKGSEIIVCASGEDEAEAISALENLIGNRFEEAE